MVYSVVPCCGITKDIDHISLQAVSTVTDQMGINTHHNNLYLKNGNHRLNHCLKTKQRNSKHYGVCVSVCASEPERECVCVCGCVCMNMDGSSLLCCCV